MFNHLDNVFNEALVLSKMQHHRIIRMFGKYRTEDHYHFVLEHCNGGDLRSFLRQYNYKSG
jgi:serine/threonine protein kinase